MNIMQLGESRGREDRKDKEPRGQMCLVEAFPDDILSETEKSIDSIMKINGRL